MKRIMMTMMAAAALWLAGDAQASEQKTGTVIVYRAASPQGMFARFQFNLNHGAAHFLRNGQKEILELPAGDYTISHDSTFGAGQDPQIVHVEAGKTVYFQYSACGFFCAFEVADDQASAARTAGKCKQVVNPYR
jgi:hypothetical protein